MRRSAKADLRAASQRMPTLPASIAMILDTVSAQQSTVDLFTAPLSVLRTVMEISYFPAISMGLVNLGSEAS